MNNRPNFLRSAVTLAQAVRWLGLALAVLCVGVAAWLWAQQVRVEPALRYKCELAAFDIVTSECLEEVSVPVNRRFEVVTSSAAVVNRWTTRPVSPGEFVHLAHLTDQDPDRFRFTTSGQELPVGTFGYYLAVPAPVLQVIQADHLLTLSLADPGVRQLGIILDQARVLEKDSAGIFLGVTMSQVAALEGLLAEIRQTTEEAQPAVLVWTITQGDNPTFPPLYAIPLDIRQLQQGGD